MIEISRYEEKDKKEAMAIDNLLITTISGESHLL